MVRHILNMITLIKNWFGPTVRKWPMIQLVYGVHFWKVHYKCILTTHFNQANPSRISHWPDLHFIWSLLGEISLGPLWRNSQGCDFVVSIFEMSMLLTTYFREANHLEISNISIVTRKIIWFGSTGGKW